jgi:glucose/arabinose dehydrogenase
MTESKVSPRRGRGFAALGIAAVISAAAHAQGPGPLNVPGGYSSVVYWTVPTSGPVPPHAPGPAPLTALTLDSQNRVCVARIDGWIYTLLDANQDGVAESETVFWDNAGGLLDSVTDILWIGPKLYVCHLGKVTTLEDTNADGAADVATDIVTNLHLSSDFHQNNGLLFDPPNHLLITNGSATDIGPDPGPLTATVLRCDLTGANLTVYASGIRNCYRMARHPVTGDVFGGDNEWNVPPVQVPPLTLQGDEINRIVQGGVYGFPNHFGLAAPGEVGPVMMLPQHVAPTGLVFNPGTAVSGYRNEMFMTTFTQGGAAALARVPVWYGLVSGNPTGFAELFANGFVNPIDVEFLPNGTVLVADFSAMAIHRIFPKSDATLTIETVPSIGTICPISLSSPTHPNATVYMGASLAPTPPVVLAPNLVVYLDVTSPVFQLSVTPGNGYFNFPVPGLLDSTGHYTASLAIPNDPGLVGYDVWLSYVVVGAGFVPIAVSPEQKVKILPQW